MQDSLVPQWTMLSSSLPSLPFVALETLAGICVWGIRLLTGKYIPFNILFRSIITLLYIEDTGTEQLEMGSQWTIGYDFLLKNLS